MRRHWRFLVLLTGAVLVYVGSLFFSGTSQVANDALQYQLNAIGQSIYEYHTATGQWPRQLDDLERTSLSLHLRYWRQVLDNGSIVVVWHDHLNADPAANRDVVLAYHNKGTLAMTGRQWVCWGDLRTEYVGSKQLRAALDANPH
jgi:hypothetical protein